MTPRPNPMTAAPEAMKGMIGLEKAVTTSGLEPTLIHLVKMRASQINGCAFCLKMHSDNLSGTVSMNLLRTVIVLIFGLELHDALETDRLLGGLLRSGRPWRHRQRS